MSNIDFGDYLRILREKNEYSQYQLGKLIGVSDKAVSKWENGYSKPKSEHVLKLARTLCVSVEELLEEMHGEK